MSDGHIGRLTSLSVRGFKSLEKLDAFTPGDVTVLIGANGSGKSNLFECFRFIRAIAGSGLQSYVETHGGAGRFFFRGPKHTRELRIGLKFDGLLFEITCQSDPAGRMLVTDDAITYFLNDGSNSLSSRVSANAQPESSLLSRREDPVLFGSGPARGTCFQQAIARWEVLHLNDSSPLAGIRREANAHHHDVLEDDGSNLGAVLLELLGSESYGLIRDVVRRVAPFFEDFLIDSVVRDGRETVRLGWTHRGVREPFQAADFSDGTLRFIALATALLRPNPSTPLFIDEPELGLHPYAVGLFADLVRMASKRTQVIISTQSPALVDRFEPAEVVVVSRKGGGTALERLDESELNTWLNDYSLGELIEKNVIRAGPTND